VLWSVRESRGSFPLPSLLGKEGGFRALEREGEQSLLAAVPLPKEGIVRSSPGGAASGFPP
jgi:hypothetical protein